MPEGQSKWSPGFYDEVEPIVLKDPLAYFLGAMEEGEVFIFKYPDAVKLAGHSCTAIGGAYKITQKALKALYGEEIPVRGEIKVSVMGGPKDMAYGPMSQVISFITGAAPATGFAGLAGRFRRQNLLLFDREHIQYNTFIFMRLDTGKMVEVRYNPDLIPEDPDLGRLAPLVIRGRASEEDIKRFKELWQDKVRKVLLEEDKIPGLIEIREISDYQFPHGEE